MNDEEKIESVPLPEEAGKDPVDSPPGGKPLVPLGCLVPDPISDSLRTRILDALVSNGFSAAEIRFVQTKGPHDYDGEAHCGSNVLRRRIP